MPAPTPRFAPPALLRATAAALLLAAGAARAEIAPLRVDPAWDLPVTGGALLLAAGLSSSWAAPGRCRICGAGALDESLRERLVWRDPRAAGTASDVLANAVLPAGVLVNSFLSARAGGDRAAFWEDALVIAEAVSIAEALNAGAKDAFARRRPTAGPGASGTAVKSFYSGHTSLAFSLATSAGTVSTLRGYPSAPWVWAGGLALASGVGYLRVAADAHWTTDVVAGAAAGGLVGFAVPWLFHRVRPGSHVRVLPAPGGVAVLF